MNIILIEPGEIIGGRIRLADRRFEHIRSVLKPAPGGVLRAGILGGARLTVRVETMAEDFCELSPVAESPALPRAGVDVLLAMPRPKCLRRLLPQIAALGVGRLYITGAEKVEKAYWGSHILLRGEWEPLLREGLEQAGDAIAPEIIIARRLKPLLEDAMAPRYAGAAKLIAHPGGDAARAPGGAEGGIVAVGPEGGWTEYELSMFARLGFTRISLGPRILRADTAVVALVSALGAAGMR